MPSRDTLGRTLSTVPWHALPGTGAMVRRLVTFGVEGTVGLPSAKAAAVRALQRRGASEAAIGHLITQHVGLAGAQGFVTSLGGALATLVTLPANVAAVVTIQARMVAGIAHLRGYEIDDARVRTGLTMCLLGPDGLRRHMDSGELPTSPLAVATAPVFDPALDLRVADRAAADLLASLGGKRATVLLGRGIPLIGGAFGLAVDGWSTYQIAQFAKSQLPSRRSA